MRSAWIEQAQAHPSSSQATMRPLKRKFSQDQDCKQEIKQTIVPQCTDDKPKIRIKSQKPGFVTKRNTFNLNIIIYIT